MAAMSSGRRRQLRFSLPAGWEKSVSTLPGSVDTDFGHPEGKGGGQSWRLQPQDVAAMVLHLLTYPENALPSLVEMRPTRPPKK